MFEKMGFRAGAHGDGSKDDEVADSTGGSSRVSERGFISNSYEYVDVMDLL